MMATCPCDKHEIVTCLDIPSGLNTLPRQAHSFGTVKKRMLESVSSQTALRGWTAEAEQDLGVMLLDMWSYVLDVTQFYDAKITDEFFLSSAKRDLSAHRIIKLLGYKPRPAMSATATLTAQIDQVNSLLLPAGAGFRSEAFDDEAPQIFQTLEAFQLAPARNQWQLKPIDDEDFPGRVLVRPSENGVPKRGILAFKLNNAAEHASQIEGLQRHNGPDERWMTEVLLEDDLDVPPGTKLSQISMRLMGQTATASSLTASFSANTLYLDTIYPRLRAGRLAVLEVNDELYPFLPEDVDVFELKNTVQRVIGVETDVSVEPPETADPGTPTNTNATLTTEVPITKKVSKVTLPFISGLTLTASTQWRLHFHDVRVGRLRAPFKTEIGKEDLEDDIALKHPQYPQKDTLNGDFVLQGSAGEATKLTGNVARNLTTKDIGFSITGETAHFTQTLRTPVNLFGNLITAVRGEAIGNEVIGSGDAGSTTNRFKLKKAPLSWIEDESQATGRRPLLDVRVDGILWDRVETFYISAAADRVYLLEEDVEHNTWVVFGDGTKGSRPSSGVGNITASYRHGAGAAKPPIGGINQTAKPIKGLAQVNNPLSLTGGADAEVASEIRRNAPATVLTLGRAVSMQDFTALASSFPGVLNVTSGWGWHPDRQRAVVMIWVAEEGALDESKLRDWLLGMAAEETPIEIVVATPDTRSLTLSIAVNDAFVADDVRTEVHTKLVEGILSIQNVPIGGVIYRSALVKEIQTVPGVESVPSIMVDALEMEWAIKVSAGTYLDFADSVTVA